ncbi:MAG: hypothetical protein GC186_07515 [Rhodobacteraceae bacterium]|nr:hypothetical protein [Paracoccaceae bacterium]
MIRAILLLLALGLARPALADEQVVAGLSENQIAITANFNGSDILVFGAVKRDAPIPVDKPLQVIITLEGPPNPVDISRKGHVYGIWINTQKVRIAAAPAFYAIATSGPLGEVLSQTDDLRYKITIPQAIQDAGIADQATDAQTFVDALIRIRKEEGLYVLDQGTVSLDQSTLFRTDIKLPANLTDGLYTARIFLTRGGKVVATHESDVLVQKAGLERWLYRLAQDNPPAYGLLSLLIAIAAGWIASAAFRLVKR